MTTTTSSGQSKTPSKWKAFRPLIAAVLLIACFGAIRVHQNLIGNTRLFFRVTLDGRTVSGVETICDGKPISSGDNISLGSHTLVVRHPKARSARTDFFQFYGRRDLEPIDIKRASGTLTLTLIPPAQSLELEGDDFKTNTSTIALLSQTVPTGEYIISAAFRHEKVRRRIVVTEGGMNIFELAPKLGGLHINANQSGATFQLLRQNGSTMSSGGLPATIDELPEGDYAVTVTHHKNTWKRAARVAAGSTNALAAYFAYGALAFVSDPPGALITDHDGRKWGNSPLTITEISPGSKKFILQKDGFEPVELVATIQDAKTNVLERRLVKTDFVRAMTAASAALQRNSFDEAITALEFALSIDPNHERAKQLLTGAKIEGGLIRAKTLAATTHYSLAVSEIRKVLRLAPENSQAKSLLPEYEKLAAEKAEGDRIKRLERAKSMFASLCNRTSDTGLFETFEVRTSKPVEEVETLIMRALSNQPGLGVTRKATGLTEAFELEAEYEFTTALKTSAGKRVLLIVGAQVKDGETHVLFKVLEYKVEAVNKFSIGNLIGTPVAVNYRPIQPDAAAKADDKFQARLREGKKELRTRLVAALGGENSVR